MPFTQLFRQLFAKLRGVLTIRILANELVHIGDIVLELLGVVS